MKRILALTLVFVFFCAGVIKGKAQSAESIWLTANTTAYKTGETVSISVNAISATPIQGFTFQIRYDPACLQPVSVTSPISGMNNLSLPQSSGLVDAAFASTIPQTAGGVLAEVQFGALADCQTHLGLENAALAIRNGSGFAAQLPGISVGNKNIDLNIGKAEGGPQPSQPAVGTALPPGSEPSSNPEAFAGAITLLLIILLASLAYSAFKFFRKRPSSD